MQDITIYIDDVPISEKLIRFKISLLLRSLCLKSSIDIENIDVDCLEAKTVIKDKLGINMTIEYTDIEVYFTNFFFFLKNGDNRILFPGSELKFISCEQEYQDEMSEILLKLLSFTGKKNNEDPHWYYDEEDKDFYPSLIERKPCTTSEEKDKCPICLNDLSDSYVITKCKHKYDLSCWNKLNNKSKCSICRQKTF